MKLLQVVVAAAAPDLLPRPAVQRGDQRFLWNAGLLCTTAWGTAWLSVILTGAEEGDASRILLGMAVLMGAGVLSAVVAAGGRGSTFRWWCYGSLLFPLALMHAVALRLRRTRSGRRV